MAAQWLETFALALLFPAYLRGPRVWLLALVPGIGPHGPGSAAVVNLILLAALVLLNVAGGRRGGWFAISPVAAALGAMICRVFQAGWAGSERLSSILWSAENVLFLASLTLFALVVERRTQNLYVQIFVRLNLIFIVVATSLVLVAT